MAVAFPLLDEIEFGLEMTPVPVWVLDIDRTRVCWVNAAGLEMWRAKTREELFAREMGAGIPPKVAMLLDDAIAQARQGHVVRHDWTFYPQGRAIVVMLSMRGVLMPDGRFALLNYAVPLGDELPAQLQRTLNMASHASFIVAFIDAAGQILTRNPAAMRAFGESPMWREWFVEPIEADAMLAAALTGEIMRTRARVRSGEGFRWHLVDVQRVRDSVDSQYGVLVEHKDESARIEAETLAESHGKRIDALRAALELVERQRQEILSLSAPILEVGEQTLAMPIIGRLHETLSAEITAQLLVAIERRRARFVILDLTGVVAIDGASLVRLRQMVNSMRLLGARAMITGIRPEVAMEMVGAGFDVEVEVWRSLAEGLRAVARR